MRRSLLLGLGIVATTLAACGGGGGSHAVPPVIANNAGGGSSSTPSSGQRANASVTIAIPARSSSANTRSPRYISANTQSMTFSLVDGSGKATQIAEFDLTPNSPGCSAVAGGGTQCAETLGAPEGTSTFQVSAFDATGGKGNTLSTATIQAKLTAGQSNTIPLVMDGVAKTASIILGSTQFQAGAPGSVSAAVQASDAAGNIIVGPGAFASPITLAVTGGDAYKALSFSQATISAPGQFVTLNYNGRSLSSATLAPSGSGITGATTTLAAIGSHVVSHVLPQYMGGPNIVSVAQDGTVWFNWNNNSAYNADGSYIEGGFAKMTADGTVTAYVGDRPAPGATPYPTPAPGATLPPIIIPPGPGGSPAPTPYPVASGAYNVGQATVVANMPNLGININQYGNRSLNALDVGHAVGDTNVYIGNYSYLADPTSTTTPPAFTQQGELQVFNPGSVSATVTNVKGEITAIHAGTDGSTWFVERPARSCSPYFPYPTTQPNWYWYQCNDNTDHASYLGHRDASGNLTETPLSSLGFQPNPYISDFTIAPDNSALYLADCGPTSAIEMVSISGGVPGTVKAVTKMTNGCPWSVAYGPDNNVYFTETNTNGGGGPGGLSHVRRPMNSNSYFVGRVAAGTGFSDANAVDWADPQLNGYPWYITAMPDGVWFSDDTYALAGRISDLSATTPTITNYPLIPAGVSDSNYSCGIAGDAVHGIVYAANCDYSPGAIEALVFGGVSNGTTVNAVRRSSR